MSLWQLEGELTCTICFSLFEDPRVLPCSHTFCRSCLEGVLQLSTNAASTWRPSIIPLKCPNCRSMLEISTGALESLPVNFALKAIIEKYRQEDQGTLTCSEHYRQPLNVYCLLDRKLVCGHCLTMGEHHGHPIEDIQSAYLKEKEASGKLMELLTDQYWTDVCLLLENLKEQKAQCESIIQDDKKLVLQYFKKFNNTLEHKKQALLTALEQVSKHLSEEYDPLIENLKQIREEQLELMSLNTDIQKEDSPLAFLETAGELQKRVQALKEKQLPEVKPVEVSPRMGYLLKEVWSKTEVSRISKILPPEIKLIPKRKLCGKGVDKEGKRLLQAVDPFLVLLLFLLGVGIVLSLHKPMSSAVIRVTPACISEFLLLAYEDFHTCFQNIGDVLCHKFNVLMEFLGRIASLQLLQ